MIKMRLGSDLSVIGEHVRNRVMSCSSTGLLNVNKVVGSYDCDQLINCNNGRQGLALFISSSCPDENHFEDFSCTLYSRNSAATAAILLCLIDEMSYWSGRCLERNRKRS